LNEEIRVPQIRLIDAEGNQLGVVDRAVALSKAQESGFDLVEIAPNAKPPVCRIMNYGKYLFQQNKKLKQKTAKVSVKQINFRPVTEEEDYRVKSRKLIEFLEHGDKAKILVRFRGREAQHHELGMRLLERLQKDLEPYGAVEQMPKFEGKQMLMVMGPKKK
jgi:translation initiation factor IF-3